MAQLENEGKQEQKNFSNDGYGFYQYCSFGKHKGCTFYDIANKGDYKYLEWCLKSFDSDGFKINATCKPHIEAALKTKGNAAQWERKDNKVQNYDQCSVWYEAILDQNIIQGPYILMEKCLACKKFKNATMYKAEYICDTCIREKKEKLLVKSQPNFPLKEINE